MLLSWVAKIVGMWDDADVLPSTKMGKSEDSTTRSDGVFYNFFTVGMKVLDVARCGLSPHLCKGAESGTSK
jgi:hypothetical protein